MAQTFTATKGTAVKGLFRLSGRATTVKAVWSELGSGSSVDWSTLGPHVVTGIVKLYLRSRPTSLLSATLLDALAAASVIMPCGQLFTALPAADLAVAKSLFTVLHAVSTTTDAAMNEHNLAIAIGVSMTPPGNGTMTEALSVKAKVVPIIAFVIKNHRALGLVEPYKPRCLIHTSTRKLTWC